MKQYNGVTVRFKRAEAVVKNGRWTSTSETLAAALNAYRMSPNISSIPSYDWALAQEVAKHFGGKLEIGRAHV